MYLSSINQHVWQNILCFWLKTNRFIFTSIYKIFTDGTALTEILWLFPRMLRIFVWTEYGSDAHDWMELWVTLAFHRQTDRALFILESNSERSAAHLFQPPIGPCEIKSVTLPVKGPWHEIRLNGLNNCNCYLDRQTDSSSSIIFWLHVWGFLSCHGGWRCVPESFNSPAITHILFSVSTVIAAHFDFLSLAR